MGTLASKETLKAALAAGETVQRNVGTDPKGNIIWVNLIESNFEDCIEYYRVKP
tara:strand:+ start:901 stop:1062 length:162 start_codon:yes stop_codon:yes gene_type:complete